MFISLLAVTFIISLIVCSLIARLFSSPVNRIMHRIIPEDISGAWVRYLTFAIYVVGISGGVRIHELERYISAPNTGDIILELTTERWIIEVYRTIIDTMASIAWMLLVFFVFALIAYVIVRVYEFKHSDRSPFHHADNTGNPEKEVRA